MAQTKVKTKGIADTNVTNAKLGTDISAAKLTAGTVADARFPATLPAASGVNLTALNATNLGSGTVPTARLGTGTADGTTFLRGDQTYAAAGGGLVLQNLMSIKTDTMTSTATTFTDISDMSLAITPTKASSKILLLGNINAYTKGVSAFQCKFQVDVDGGGYADVPFLGATAGSRTRCAFYYYAGSGIHENHNMAWQYLHTPTYTLTDVLTYKLVFRLESSSDYLYVNRTFDDTDNTSYSRGASVFQLLEID